MKEPRRRAPTGIDVSRETSPQPDASGSRANLETIARDVRERVALWLGETTLLPRGRFLERIGKLAATLALWGAYTNLTASPGDPAEIAFHIIDSLAPFAFASGANRDDLEAALAEDKTALDIGSGAGFPGLVLAAAFQARFTLVESRRKRASFLQVAAHEMNLKNVAIEQRRLSARTVSRGFDLVTARAFGTSAELYEIAAAALRPGAMFLLYGGLHQSSSEKNLAEENLEATGESQARRAHLTGPAAWSYRLLHRERVIIRTAAFWHK